MSEQSPEAEVDELFDNLEREAQAREVEERKTDQKYGAEVDELFDNLEQGAQTNNEHPAQETSEQREKRIAEGWTTPDEDKALAQEKYDKREAVSIRDAMAENFSPEAAEIVELGMEDFEGSKEADTASTEASELMRGIADVINGKKGFAKVVIIGKNKHGEAISDTKGHDIDEFVTEIHKLLGATGERAKPYSKDGKVELPAGGGLVTSYSGYSSGEATPDDYSVKELTPTGLVITERYIDHQAVEWDPELRMVAKDVTVAKFSPTSPEHIGLSLKLDKRKASIQETIQEKKEKLKTTFGDYEVRSLKGEITFLESEIKVIDSLKPKDETSEKLAA